MKNNALEKSSINTTSPSTQSSTWQLRFGKKSTFRLNLQHDGVKSKVENQAHSPSITDQLLRGLNKKSNEQEDLSHECVDVLIGRRNAFASEPEWRLRTRTRDADDEDVAIQEKLRHGDVAAEAKEIIRTRLHIEKKAYALRRASKNIKEVEQRRENKYLDRLGLASTELASHEAFKDVKSATTNQSSSKKKMHARSELRNLDNQEVEMTLTKDTLPPKQQVRSPRQRKSCTFKSKNKSRSRVLPPQQLPMERRHELLLQARRVRKTQAAEEAAMNKLRGPACGDDNKNVGQEQRHITEKIERLTLDNQHAAVLNERLEKRKARLTLLSNLLYAWYRFVKLKREQEARVVAELNWRVLKCVMAKWRRYTLRRGQTKAVEQARLNMVREQKMNEQAQQFYRLNRLPIWLYRWMAFVTQQQGHRSAVQAVGRRRVQSKRLIEKLQRQNAISKFDCDGGQSIMEASDIEKDDLATQETASECERKVSGESGTQLSLNTDQSRQNSKLWTDSEDCQATRSVTGTKSLMQGISPSQLTSRMTRASKHADKIYKAMEQRAAKRKQRRDELKRRYEELEQKKRQEQEQERATREALLFEKQVEEKTRIRKRKLEEALVLKEKQERRDHLLAQWDKARDSNRRRLLYFYALLPWQKHQALIERVARNATRWHELRTVYLVWERWQEFVQICQKVRCRRERIQLEKAARFHAQTIQRRALWRLAQHHQSLQSRTLLVWSQHQWSTLKQSWKHWKRCFVYQRAYQEEIVSDAMICMQQFRLRQICARWHKATNEAKRLKHNEFEKKQLWLKVRGWLDETN